MQKESASLPEIKLVGISVRTNNKLEIDPNTGKIFGIVQKYFHGQLADQIQDRKKPGTTFCAYTNYESDHNGDYTYLIGEEVNDFGTLPEGFEKLSIPAQAYAKFTNGPGPMPEVVREPWFKIWNMSAQDLGGERSYQTDFELYDERAADHEKIVLDIFIGLKS
ncbi:MAG: AraC family transcriptional regulator [Deltaproteobacteria bacterium]|nr:AraC family transcriptional regulator [Deltaproteobacteria bacterium]